MTVVMHRSQQHGRRGQRIVNVFYATITFCVFIYLLVCFIFGFVVVCLSMGSWTLLQTILMAFLFFPVVFLYFVGCH